MTTLPQTRLTPEEYLQAERQADVKSEYHDGEVLSHIRSEILVIPGS